MWKFGSKIFNHFIYHGCSECCPSMQQFQLHCLPNTHGRQRKHKTSNEKEQSQFAIERYLFLIIHCKIPPLVDICTMDRNTFGIIPFFFMLRKTTPGRWYLSSSLYLYDKLSARGFANVNSNVPLAATIRLAVVLHPRHVHLAPSLCVPMPQLRRQLDPGPYRLASLGSPHELHE